MTPESLDVIILVTWSKFYISEMLNANIIFQLKKTYEANKTTIPSISILAWTLIVPLVSYVHIEISN